VYFLTSVTYTFAVYVAFVQRVVVLPGICVFVSASEVVIIQKTVQEIQSLFAGVLGM